MNGQSVTQTTGGVLDARRNFAVNGSRAKADLRIGTVTAAGVYQREVASAGSQLAHARSTYETDWAALNLESSGWSLGNPYLWLTSGAGGSNGSSTTGGTTTGGSTTSPDNSDPPAASSPSGYLSESWAPQNPQSSDGGSGTPTTGGNPPPSGTNGTTTGTGTPTMPVVPSDQDGVAGDDSPQYEPPEVWSPPSLSQLDPGLYASTLGALDSKATQLLPTKPVVPALASGVDSVLAGALDQDDLSPHEAELAEALREMEAAKADLLTRINARIAEENQRHTLSPIASRVDDYASYYIGVVNGFAVDGLWGDIELLVLAGQLQQRMLAYGVTAGIRAQDAAINGAVNGVWDDWSWYDLAFPFSAINGAARGVAAEFQPDAEKLVEAARKLKQFIEFIRNAQRTAEGMLAEGVMYRLGIVDEFSPNTQLSTIYLSTALMSAGAEATELSREDVGRLVGMVLWEVVLGLVTQGVATELKAGKHVSRAIDEAMNLLVKRLNDAGDLKGVKFLQNLAQNPRFTDAIKKLVALMTGISDETSDAGRVTLNVLTKTCFAAGTPVLTPGGQKKIEEFEAGDHILSRPEDRPDAPVRTSVVEEVFELSAPILELRLGGQTIKTTAEHPFYVAEKGWIRAEKLEAGDLLVGHHNILTSVQSVTYTDRRETVYNVRVADDHTYFVGDHAWGFSVWVHNAYSIKQAIDGSWQVLDEAGEIVSAGLNLKEAGALMRNFNSLASALKKFPGAIAMDIRRLGTPVSRQIAEVDKLNRLLKFDWLKYEPIEVIRLKNGTFKVVGGVTRYERALREGIYHLPVYIIN